LINLLTYILSEKNINILALEMARQGTGTVPIVSAQSRSSATANDVSSAVRRIAKSCGHLAVITAAVVPGFFRGGAPVSIRKVS